MLVRAERQGDYAAVYALNAAAFETPAEAGLVNTLREQANPCISLVAEQDGLITGHILFTPASLSSDPALNIMGLAPMAVLPERQRQGIGSQLVRAGLQRCRHDGYHAVAVLGHPDYYPKFGFQPSVNFNIRSEYDVPDEAFMLIELVEDGLSDKSGVIQYHPAFNSL